MSNIGNLNYQRLSRDYDYNSAFHSGTGPSLFPESAVEEENTADPLDSVSLRRARYPEDPWRSIFDIPFESFYPQKTYQIGEAQGTSQPSPFQTFTAESPALQNITAAAGPVERESTLSNSFESFCPNLSRLFNSATNTISNLFEYQSQAREMGETKAYNAGNIGTNYTDPKDWHIPQLNEVFDLALKPEFSGENGTKAKKIAIDCKTSENPDVARRLAKTIISDVSQYSPEQQAQLRERMILMNPSKDCIAAMKDEFQKAGGDWAKFSNFLLDNESLNNKDPRSTLEGAEGCNYVAVGNPKLNHNFDDLLKEVKDVKSKIDDPDPNNQNKGKKLYVWTINDSNQIRDLVKAGADGLMTDDPERAKTIIKEMVDKGEISADKAPDVIAHRGGPNSKENPENTLPRIERGLQGSDAIEIDVCVTKDNKAAVFHDNDPYNIGNKNTDWMVGTVRNLGLEADNDYRPIYPDIGSSLRGKRIDEISFDELKNNYGYEENATHSVVANFLNTAAANGLRLPGVALNWLGGKLGNILGAPLKAAGSAWNWATDNIGKPVIKAGVQVLDSLGTGIWKGITDVGKGIGNGVSDIFKGNIAKGIGEVGTGIWNGIKDVGTGIWDAGKSVVNGIAKVGENIWNGVKNVAEKAWEGIKDFFSGW